MTTASNHPRRPWLPALNLLLAGGAVVLGVIAITTDDAGSSPPAQAPAPAVVAGVQRPSVAAEDPPRHNRPVPPIGESSTQEDACRNGPIRGLPIPC
jgi:hypothetical protein